MRDGAKLDETQELLLARVHDARDNGRYDDALEILRDLEAHESATTGYAAGARLCRAEIFVASDRSDAAVAEIRAFLRDFPRHPLRNLARCWLYGLLREEHPDQATAILAEIELDISTTPQAALRGVFTLQIAWFAALVGELQRSESYFQQWHALSPDAKGSLSLAGFVATAVRLAQESVGMDAAAQWSDGLVDRIERP